jgi:predicted metal-dependent hydrolase
MGIVSLFDPMDLPEVEVQRSPRRRRTISAHWSGAKIIVQVPERMSRAERAAAVQEMVERLLRQQRRRRVTDGDLTELAARLSTEFLDGLAQPSSVTWSRSMTSRWGSCTPEDRTIRLSHRLSAMPRYVQEYVLVHELAHLIEIEHNEAFWGLVRRYPGAERAIGYLEGWSEARDLPHASTGPDGA